MTNAEATEIKVARKNTMFILNSYGKSVDLYRPNFTSVAGGRRKSAPTPLDPQVFDVSLSPISTETTTRGGVQNAQTANLRGRWDADIQRGDWFVFDGKEFTVTTVARTSGAVNCEAVTSG